MKIHELDVIRLKDGRDATVLEVHGDGESYLVDTDAKAYEESELLEVHVSDVSKVVYRA